MHSDLEFGPEAVGDELPECGDYGPAAIDGGYAAALHDGFFDDGGYMVDGHQHGVVAVALQQWSVDEAGTDVGDADVDMLAVGELVECLEISPLITF